MTKRSAKTLRKFTGRSQVSRNHPCMNQGDFWSSSKAVSFLQILIGVYLIFITPVMILIFNYSFYDYNFKRNGAYDELGEEYAWEVTENLWLYYANFQKLNYFEENAKEHMHDVKIIYNILFVIWLISLSYLFYFIKKINLKNYLNKVLLSNSIIALLLIVGAFFFNSFFYYFHIILFPQGNFTFPEGSLIITLFAHPFFQNALITVIFIQILLLLAVYFKKRPL